MRLERFLTNGALQTDFRRLSPIFDIIGSTDSALPDDLGTFPPDIEESLGWQQHKETENVVSFPLSKVLKKSIF